MLSLKPFQNLTFNERQVIEYRSLYFLNESPPASNAVLSFGKDEGPIPCKANISFSENFDSCFRLSMHLLASARFAGATKPGMKSLLVLSAFLVTAVFAVLPDAFLLFTLFRFSSTLN